MKNKKLEYLIDDFLAQVERATDLLEDKFGKSVYFSFGGKMIFREVVKF